MSTPLSPETLAWLRQAAATGLAEAMVLRHVMERLDALEAADRLDAEAWASMRRANCDHQRRLLILEAAQQQPVGYAPAATGMVATPESAPVATDDELFDLFRKHDPLGIALRVIYNLGRQHGAAQPQADQPAPEAAPVAALAEGLVVRLRSAVRPLALMDDEWQAVIREVAAWLDHQGYNRAANDLREEVAE